MTDDQRNRFASATLAPGVEAATAAFQDLSFSPHRHDAYAVGVTSAGVQAFTYRGTHRYALPGDVFVLHPDELHDGAPGEDGGYAYSIVYLDPVLIFDALDGGPLPFVAEGVGDFAPLRDAIRLTFTPTADPAEPLTALDRAVAFADGMANAAANRQPTGPAIDRAAMARLRERLTQDMRARPGLAALERELGLSRYAMSRQFKAYCGVAPSRFLQMRRLERARAGIEAGLPLADAAYAAGFSDQSHMTRGFTQAYGLPPARWRRMAAAAD